MIMEHFINPTLLYCLPVALLPVILYWSRFRRVQTVDLATFRFLDDMYFPRRRRNVCIDALIVLLRVLFLLFIICLCARPAVRHWHSLLGRRAGGEVVLFVDTSFSMGAAADGRTALDRAQSAARSIVERLGPNDTVTFVEIGAKPNNELSQLSDNRDRVYAKINELQPVSPRANMRAAFVEAFGPRAPKRRSPDIYVLTDCQSCGWVEFQSNPVNDVLPRDSRLTVIDCGSKLKRSNVGVIGSAPRHPRTIKGLPVLLEPRVKNCSATTDAVVVLSVLIDDDEIARQSVPLAKGESKSLEFMHTPAHPGSLRGTFRISSGEQTREDGFPLDNEFHFAVTVLPPAKIVMLSDNSSAVGSVVLKAALNASGSFELHDAVPSTFNEPVLEGASVVILSDSRDITARQFGWLHTFVSSGGGLIVFPGTNVSHEDYNSRFFERSDASGAQFSELKMRAAFGDVHDTGTVVLNAPNYAHPMFAALDNGDSRLSSAHFHRRFALEVPANDSGRRNFVKLLSFSDGQPALIESKEHDGITLFAAFPADIDWSDLPSKSDFVLLVLQMVQYAAYHSHFDAPTAVEIGQPSRITANGQQTPRGTVTAPSGRPSRLEFKQTSGTWIAATDQCREVGFYRIDLDDGRKPGDAHFNCEFAANLPAEESDFTRIDENQLRSMLPGREVRFVDASAEVEERLGQIGRDQSEMWHVLLLLGFLAFAGEFLLATRAA